MIKITRIKTVQAPRTFVDDLSAQMDGVVQTFYLSEKVTPQDTHYLVWNGQTYKNDKNHTFYTVADDGMSITTTFDSAPIPGDDKALQFVKTGNTNSSSNLATTDYVDFEIKALREEMMLLFKGEESE